MGLTQYAEQVFIAIAKGEVAHARKLVGQAVFHLPPVRKSRVERYLATDDKATAQGVKLKHWTRIAEPRSPWVPTKVRDAIMSWHLEVSHADALIEAGERVLPLLLTGETRCGKTTSLCAVAEALGLDVYRMTLADVVGSHLGESARFMREALGEIKTVGGAMWIVDEIDGVAPRRLSANDSAAQDRAHAVGSLLSELEAIPPTTPLVATTNLVKTIDDAVLGRFAVVHFPRWSDLAPADRMAFAESHGFEPAGAGDSYADAVKSAREHRVAAVIEAARSRPDADEEDAPDQDERPSETPQQREMWLAELRRERQQGRSS